MEKYNKNKPKITILKVNYEYPSNLKLTTTGSGFGVLTSDL